MSPPKKPPAAKRKGGPVPGTPSPMRTRLSPELQAHARRQFEETDRPTTHIALDCGVDESVLRRMAQREGWERYVPPPRDLPPVAKLLAEVEALERDRHPEERAQRASKGDGQSSGPSFEGGLRPPPQDDGEGEERVAAIDRLHRAAMSQLAEVEALRARTTPAAKDAERNAHTLSSLTETIRKLQGMRCALHVPGSTHDDHAYDMPADLDEFRDELARRIRAFVASRTGTRDADGNSGPAVDQVR
jgi:hypothetical protein